VKSYRVATCLMLLFCLGHTAGGMLSHKSLGPAADAVFSSMKSVHFPFNGASCTYYGFWLAFGLLFSVFLIFSAFVAWRLADVDPEDWPAVAPIAWALVAAHACDAILGWIYFFPGSAILATLITILLATGASTASRRPQIGSSDSVRVSR
jgi:hypothetical protein